MPSRQRPELPILARLAEEFEKVREKVEPVYPFDAKTGAIHLPRQIENELRSLVIAGDKVEAIKRVTRLTGAGLRLAKEYVDRL